MGGLGSGRNNRGGKRAKDAGGRTVKTASGIPRRPTGMSRDEAWYWDNAIAKAAHLGEMDTPMAIACCELWGFYRASVQLAKNDPADKNARLAVTSYFEKLDKAASKLSLDPLGRERVSGGSSGEIDPLEEFGIVG